MRNKSFLIDKIKKLTFEINQNGKRDAPVPVKQFKGNFPEQPQNVNTLKQSKILKPKVNLDLAPVTTKEEKLDKQKKFLVAKNDLAVTHVSISVTKASDDSLFLEDSQENNVMAPPKVIVKATNLALKEYENKLFTQFKQQKKLIKESHRNINDQIYRYLPDLNSQSKGISYLQEQKQVAEFTKIYPFKKAASRAAEISIIDNFEDQNEKFHEFDHTEMSITDCHDD